MESISTGSKNDCILEKQKADFELSEGTKKKPGREPANVVFNSTPPSSVPPSPIPSPRNSVVKAQIRRQVRHNEALSAPLLDSKDCEMPLSTSRKVEVEADLRNHPLEKILKLERLPLPAPKKPSKCPLFCCFYAEFDIKVGPIVCFQSPRNFMNQDINISAERVHEILAKTFERLTCNDAAGCEEGLVSLGGEEREKVSGEDTIFKGSEGSLSIFDSTSEYIITGNELTGKIITLSTHDMHIMTRPTIISDQRYERNALMFSVGFVLRRAADPRPFRPLLSKLAMTIRSMEVESQLLCNPSMRKQVQPLLERILLSLNSPQCECNLILSQSNALNLKLFHPPKPEASPVHDHQVPILLRRDLQLQMVR